VPGAPPPAFLFPFSIPQAFFTCALAPKETSKPNQTAVPVAIVRRAGAHNV
jgi:hypothetical protein